MNYDLLEYVTGLLTAAGIPAGEEYPALERPEIHSPRAVVGLQELDGTAGTALVRVKILSPRILGGWCCQAWAMSAVRALSSAGLDCRAEEMTYNSGCDCFCVAVETRVSVQPTADGWEAGAQWWIFCGEERQPGVVSFRAVQDLQRRIVGTHGKTDAVAVTGGTGGWNLELVQRVSEEPTSMTEPFELRVAEGNIGHRYTGCCWNETVWEYVEGGARLTRRGFALTREVT